MEEIQITAKFTKNGECVSSCVPIRHLMEFDYKDILEDIGPLVIFNIRKKTKIFYALYNLGVLNLSLKVTTSDLVRQYLFETIIIIRTN